MRIFWYDEVSHGKQKPWFCFLTKGSAVFDKRLFSLVPEAKGPIIANVALQWAALLANIALFVAMGRFLGRLLDGASDMQELGILVAVAACAIVVRFVCQAFALRAGARAASRAKCAVRQRVYDKLVALGPGYRERTSTAAAVQVCVEGAEQLEAYFGSYTPQLFYAVLAPLTLFVCLAPLSLPAALTLLACVPLIPVSIVAIQKIAKRTMGRYWNSYTDLGATFLENIQGLATLKVFSADERAHEAMNGQAEGFRRATMRLLRMQLNSITVMDLFAFGGAALGIVCAIAQYEQGAIGFAAAFAIVFLSAEFFLPLRTLGSFFHTAMGGMAVATRMFAILDAPEPGCEGTTVDVEGGDVRCKGVGYSYDGERQVLYDVDFVARRGSFVGIAGASGSGKSTFAGVLAGSNPGFTGTVEIGGVDVRQASRESLARTLTYVSSSSYVFAGSVADNLRLADPQADDAALWHALARCRLADFIRSIGGLDAQLSAGAANLSGGQRQRLALARALLHDSPLYVFDEATSNVDVASERAILDVIAELAREEKTVVVISHRLAALRDADRIYVFEDGRIVQQGTHDELAAAGGSYELMWREQERLEHVAAQAQTGAASVRIDDTAAALPMRRTLEQGFSSARRSKLAVMAGLVKLVGPLAGMMALAVAFGIAGFLAAIGLTLFAAVGLLDVAGMPAGASAVLSVWVLFACGVVRGPLRYAEQLCNHYLAFKILAVVRDKVFARLRMLAPAKLEGRDKGDLVSLITSDVELLEVFFAHTLSPVLIAAAVSAIMAGFVFALSPLLGFIAVAAYLTVGVAVPLVASKASGGLGRDVRDGMGALNSFVLESLRGLRETLQFANQQKRSAQLACRMKGVAADDARLKRQGAFAFSATGAVVLAFDIAMVAVASALVMQGDLSFQAAVLASAALLSSFGPVIALANLGSTLQGTLAAGGRVLDLLDERPATPDVVCGTRLSQFTGACARGVGFSYGEERVLEGVDVSIPRGSVVQITGKSGSGKSTLLKLFMRFWDADAGVVEISDADIKGVTTESLRSVEGFMAQDTHLFAGTVRDNVALGRPDASDDDVFDALEKASLRGVVERLPQGLDTQVGELGETLSAGERQRLGLARVFLHDAPFVLLDEPTSNLDSLNEAAVLSSIADNHAGRTVVLVSHRPSAASFADVSYSVERGKVS